MSFLDNLENSLKALESADERGADKQSQERRDAERVEALAIAPWAERLRTDPFTKSLLEIATLAGHKIRTKVRIIWLGPTLRLETRDRRLELRPTSNGIVAAIIENGADVQIWPIDLREERPEDLVERWLGADVRLPRPLSIKPK